VSERKTTEIKLRVSPEEKTSWQLAAEQREVGLSQFIRDCVDESTRDDRNRFTNSADRTLRDKVDNAVAHLRAFEDSSVEQAVPTSGEANLVAKPWMFEARSGD
jgi:hypothetical protein